MKYVRRYWKLGPLEYTQVGQVRLLQWRGKPLFQAVGRVWQAGNALD